MGRLALLAGLAVSLAGGGGAPAPAAAGELEIRVVDRHSGEPLAVRMHLKDARGRPVRPPGAVAWADHFVFDSTIKLNLKTGAYTFEMERGPEYRVRYGHFTIEPGANDSKTVDMARLADMRAEGWWSGDLDVERPAAQLPLLLKADDLHLAAVATWGSGVKTPQWSKLPPGDDPRSAPGPARYTLLAGREARAGGVLGFYGLPRPLTDDATPAAATAEFPSLALLAREARTFTGGTIDAPLPFAWDLPVWIAHGSIDSVGLANRHQLRDGVLDHETGGKPRDRTFFPGAKGNGRWSQTIYYHLLNCGLRVPPSAGSGSGVTTNPVGYNRVYVHCGDEFTYERWWEGLRAGRVTVTNGPLLRPLVNGEMPGHVFSAEAGEEVELLVGLNLGTRDAIEYLEIVQNGAVVHEVRLDDWAKMGGELPPIRFRESGWLLVRAVTGHADSYRFASTGPYYVEIGYQPRISRRSVQFFLDWVYERARQLQLADAEQQAAVLAEHRAARDFWQRLFERANAD